MANQETLPGQKISKALEEFKDHYNASIGIMNKLQHGDNVNMTSVVRNLREPLTVHPREVEILSEEKLENMEKILSATQLETIKQTFAGKKFTINKVRRDCYQMQIPSRIEWQINLEDFPVVRRAIEGFFTQAPLAYIFEDPLLHKYCSMGPSCYTVLQLGDINHKIIISDATHIYGALTSVCRNDTDIDAIINNRISKFGDFKDGIMAWIDILDNFDNMESKEVMRIMLENKLYAQAWRESTN